jgi:hypothetical protein
MGRCGCVVVGQDRDRRSVVGRKCGGESAAEMEVFKGSSRRLSQFRGLKSTFSLVLPRARHMRSKGWFGVAFLRCA